MLQDSGSIKVILGCMFSGKTTSLIREYREWVSIKKQPLCINFSGDNRYGNISENNMYNHNSNFVQCIHVTHLADVNEQLICDSDVILINEGQFFDDLVEYCTKWCDEYKKHIVVCGLDGDFKRRPFGKILDLIPLADHVEKINAFCASCANGKKAIFTKRITNEEEQYLIGTNNYIAVCRKCYFEQNK
jgi:thymidine kinase